MTDEQRTESERTGDAARPPGRRGEDAGEDLREAQEAHGGSMAPQIVDDTGRPTAEPPPGGGE